MKIYIDNKYGRRLRSPGYGSTSQDITRHSRRGACAKFHDLETAAQLDPADGEIPHLGQFFDMKYSSTLTILTLKFTRAKGNYDVTTILDFSTYCTINHLQHLIDHH
ncbi:hypothetical protein SeLEV6574_g04846, partial [Synchytrium endobioticum]